MYQKALGDSSLFASLWTLDQEQAAATRLAGCSCGGKLHSAAYRRKPRGGPEDLGEEICRRESFCCARDGCRRRATPPSLRFLGRKVYFSVCVLLLTALRHGPSPRRLRELNKHYPVSLRTLRRWQVWWRQTLPKSRVWAALKGRFARPVDETLLPYSLLAAFSHLPRIGDQVVAVLRCLLDPKAVSLLCERA